MTFGQKPSGNGQRLGPGPAAIPLQRTKMWGVAEDDAPDPLFQRRTPSAGPASMPRTHTTNPPAAPSICPDLILLTTAEVARVLKVSLRCLERWRITGEGPPFVRLSRNAVRYDEQALRAFLCGRQRDNTIS